MYGFCCIGSIGGVALCWLVLYLFCILLCCACLCILGVFVLFSCVLFCACVVFALCFVACSVGLFVARFVFCTGCIDWIVYVSFCFPFALCLIALRCLFMCSMKSHWMQMCSLVFY